MFIHLLSLDTRSVSIIRIVFRTSAVKEITYQSRLSVHKLESNVRLALQETLSTTGLPFVFIVINIPIQP